MLRIDEWYDLMIQYLAMNIASEERDMHRCSLSVFIQPDEVLDFQ